MQYIPVHDNHYLALAVEEIGQLQSDIIHREWPFLAHKNPKDLTK